MISRKIQPPQNKSFFLLGARGTGKSLFIREQLKPEIFVNLTEDQVFQALLAHPERLGNFLPSEPQNWVVVDDLPLVPDLFQETEKLATKNRHSFILTGSNVKKIARSEKALSDKIPILRSFPLTAFELQDEFRLQKALQSGLLPKAYLENDSAAYLAAYISTYLKEEILQSGLVRDLASFARFLEAASLAQAQVLNQTQVSELCGVERKTVANFFQLLHDLLLSHQLDVYSVKAKRPLTKHKKFYFFDVGVYRHLRSKGPLETFDEQTAIGLESLVLQELIARNHYQKLNYTLNYWHTKNHLEVDFVLSGERGLKGFDVVSREVVRDSDLKGLLALQTDYPDAKLYLLYLGQEKRTYKTIQLIPIGEFLLNADRWV